MILLKVYFVKTSTELFPENAMCFKRMASTEARRNKDQTNMKKYFEAKRNFCVT